MEGKLDASVLTRVQNIIAGKGGILRFVLDLEKVATLSPNELKAAKALITAAFDGIMEAAEGDETQLDIVIRQE